MAVCTVFFGRQSRDERIVKESTKIYTRALAQLNAALSNKTMHTRDETLAATMLLGMYETMGCADPLTWQRHADGMELLVRVRGPEAHTTELGHRLFTSFRGTSLTNSLVSCKRNFLASKEWLTIPWTKTQKTPMQQLQDLHLELPGILEARRALPRSAHPSLLRRCLDFKAKLEAWYENFISTPSAHHWLEFSALNIDPPVFPTCYRFPNIGVANTYTFYWANLIVLNYTIIGLTPACQSPLVTTDEIYDLAAQICMSVEYFVAPERKSYGPVLTMYPLRVATGCFMRMGARGKKSTLWCKAIFGVLGERGVMLAKMLEMVVWENKETEEAESVGTVHEWAKKEFWGRVEEGLDEPETEM
ncbi:unnamed protein product [Tuber melanosporum]|uniref:(Perigord truffle) hypothetical protein n=1 Tax=Tuber melanosporum (strain Mel28) TaxID=656061 RepID=D5GEQ1_TUBMM|nr:uncharacterized protein GSTUM_00001325001 [Tuber melanosporum]CAZ82994.1 unnamed protein product [Tuber melanosporum]